MPVASLHSNTGIAQNQLSPGFNTREEQPAGNRIGRHGLQAPPPILNLVDPDLASDLQQWASRRFGLGPPFSLAAIPRLYRETIEIKRRTLGPDHRSTLVTMGSLANLLAVAGRYSEAEQILRQTLQIERRTLGPDHYDTLASLVTLAEDLKFEGRYAEAEKIYKEALEARRRTLGVDHPDVATTSYDSACVLALEGKRDEAFSNLQFAVEHALSSEMRQRLEKDADFQSLRGDPRFEALRVLSPQRAAAAENAN